MSPRQKNLCSSITEGAFKTAVKVSSTASSLCRLLDRSLGLASGAINALSAADFLARHVTAASVAINVRSAVGFSTHHEAQRSESKSSPSLAARESQPTASQLSQISSRLARYVPLYPSDYLLSVEDGSSGQVRQAWNTMSAIYLISEMSESENPLAVLLEAFGSTVAVNAFLQHVVYPIVTLHDARAEQRHDLDDAIDALRRAVDVSPLIARIDAMDMIHDANAERKNAELAQEAANSVEAEYADVRTRITQITNELGPLLRRGNAVHSFVDETSSPRSVLIAIDASNEIKPSAAITRRM